MKITLTESEAKKILQDHFRRTLSTTLGEEFEVEIWDGKSEGNQDVVENSTITDRETEYLKDNYNELYDFLNKNNALSKYVVNFKNEIGGPNCLSLLLDMNMAFNWSNSPEGHHYWRNLSARFDSL